MNLTAGPNHGLGTWPARRARISPGRTALLDPHRSLTYTQLADRTARYAGALRRLGVGPEGVWMVGDHLEWDVLAPQRLGLTGVWIDREGAGLPADADARPHRIIGSLSELLA